MNVFYYPATACREADIFQQALLKEHSLHALIVLPGGCQLNSPLCLKLRSGDILILFAADPAGLDALLALHESFEEFRVILVMEKVCDDQCLQRAHQLVPRYVTTSQDLKGLTTVIDRMLFREDTFVAATTLSMEEMP